MRNLTASLLALAVLMLLAASPASATKKHCYSVCWAAKSSSVICKCLPEDYSLPLDRPVCEKRNCKAPRTEFALTKDLIKSISTYVPDTSSMAPGAKGYIQAAYRRVHKP